MWCAVLVQCISTMGSILLRHLAAGVYLYACLVQSNHGARGHCGLCVLQLDMLQAKLCQLLGRSLMIDESTAKFYLEDAGGDVKAAMETFGETAYPRCACLRQRQQ